MKKLLPLFLLSISLTSYGQYVLRKDQLNAINARDIKAGGAYSSFKLGKLIDSLILSLNSQRRAAGYLPVGNASGIAVDVALSGDGTLSSAGALAVTKLLGNAIPANASGALVNNGSGSLSWTTVASTFQSLTDGPGSFTGKTLNYSRVNAGETALEYRTPSQVLSDIGGIGLSSLSATSPIFYNNSTGVISSQAATTSLNGYLTSTDWTNFNTGYNRSGTGLTFSSSTFTFTKQDASTLTVSVPTFNQNTTGSAATLTTPRNIQGVAFDGSANINPINGTGFVKATGTTLSYDNSTYLTGNQTVTLSGDVTGSGATSISTTVGKINGTSLAGLATGILKNTTSTGVPSIAVAGDFPTLNQNTTGSAGSVANDLTVDNSSIQLNSGTTYNGGAAKTISVKAGGITNSMLAGSIDLTSKVTGTLTVANGGTGTSSPSLVAGGGISITGSWPNQTVSASSITFSSISGATTLSSSDFGKVFTVTGTSADYTIGLPTAVGNSGSGITFIFSSALTKFITLDGNASETINGSLIQGYWAKEAVTVVSDGSNYMIMNGTKVKMAASMAKSSTSVTNNTDTKIVLDTNSGSNVLYDNTGFISDASGGKITVKRDGIYTIAGVVEQTGGTTTITQQYAKIFINGSNARGWRIGNPSGHSNATTTVVTASLSAGDYIELYCNQNSGSTLTYTSTLNVIEE